MKYGKRASWKKYLYSPVSMIIVAIILFFLIRAAWNIHEKAVAADKRLQLAEQELSDLQKQKAVLSTSIAYLSTPEGIEATLRDKYHAVKDGESVAVIIDAPSTTKDVVSSSSDDISSGPWWSRVLSQIWHFVGL